MDSPSRRSTLTIALCFIVALIEGFDLQAAGTTAAGLRQSFALDPKMLGWVFSVGIIGLLPGRSSAAGSPTESGARKSW